MQRLILLPAFALLLTEAAAHGQLYTVKPGPGSLRQEQRRRAQNNGGQVQISVEIYTGRQGVGLPALRWRSVLDDLGIPISIRSVGLGKEPSISETRVGKLRRVVVTGHMDRRGRLIFADREFSPNDAARLRTWLKELQTYGALGSPEGQPAWGLSREQFEALHAVLSRPLETEVAGLSLEQEISQFAIPDTYPVRYPKLASRKSARGPERRPAVRNSPKGFAKGTALAVLLSEYGLGFRPRRTPAGAIEIEIVPLSDENGAWPVGWEPTLPRPETAPRLFTPIPIELKDARLADVLKAVAVRSEVPILIDYHRIEAGEIDLDNLRVSYPPRKSTYSTLLKVATTRHHLTQKLRVDERGEPFVWITTLRPERLQR